MKSSRLFTFIFLLFLFSNQCLAVATIRGTIPELAGKTGQLFEFVDYLSSEKNQFADFKIDENGEPSKKQLVAKSQRIGKMPTIIFSDSIVVPPNFQKLGEATGDLNNDNIDEKIIVFDTNRKTDLGTEREIYIYKKNNHRWELWHKSLGAVLPSEHGGIMGDPFEGVEIERGALVFYHYGGSRQKWNYTHRFRFQNEQWELIGATIYYGALCDSWENFDYNLVTGNIEYYIEFEPCDDEEQIREVLIKEKNFIRKLSVLPKMDGFYPGNNMVKIPEINEAVYY